MAERDDHSAVRVEALAERVLESISDAILAVDGEWRVVYANQATEELFACAAEALVGHDVLKLLNTEADDPFEAAWRSSKQSGVPSALCGPSATLGLWLQARGHPSPAGYTVVLRPVSLERDSHRARLAATREERARQTINQRIFETSVDLLLVASRTGDFIQVSPSSEAILGYRPEEMIGRNAVDFLYPPDLESTRDEMRMARRGGVTRYFECRYIHKDGRIVTLAWTGVWSEAEQRHFFIGRDMTERIATEERLRRSERLEVVGQLTGGIAHDFNNLLTIIMGNLDLLKTAGSVAPADMELVDAAFDAAVRGARLTHQLLAFARRQSLDSRTFQINQRVDSVMDLLRRTLGEQVEIETQLADDLWPAFADTAQFDSALLNLAINARDAMASGGRLIIETANRELDAAYAEENEITPGAYVMVAVSDTGGGMPPDVLARVFEPFFTTKEAGKGTGMGLSMVYGFARQSHGHVKIYSEVGHGTTVRLYLPRAGENAAEATAQAPPVAEPARPGERILVVEDNTGVRQVVLRQLAGLGYEVLEADSGEAGLSLLASGERVDVLFSDVVMPGMGGFELAEAAVALRPDLRILLTSGFAKGTIDGRTRRRRSPALLSKPYRTVDLAAKLRDVLDAPGGASR